MRIRYSLFRSVVALVMVASSASAQGGGRTTFGVLLGGTAAKVTDVDVGAADLFNGLSTIKNR